MCNKYTLRGQVVLAESACSAQGLDVNGFERVPLIVFDMDSEQLYICASLSFGGPGLEIKVTCGGKGDC
jgi:hypothetical protein